MYVCGMINHVVARNPDPVAQPPSDVPPSDALKCHRDIEPLPSPAFPIKRVSCKQIMPPWPAGFAQQRIDNHKGRGMWRGRRRRCLGFLEPCQVTMLGLAREVAK